MRDCSHCISLPCPQSAFPSLSSLYSTPYSSKKKKARTSAHPYRDLDPSPRTSESRSLSKAGPSFPVRHPGGLGASFARLCLAFYPSVQPRSPRVCVQVHGLDWMGWDGMRRHWRRASQERRGGGGRERRRGSMRKGMHTCCTCACARAQRLGRYVDGSPFFHLGNLDLRDSISISISSFAGRLPGRLAGIPTAATHAGTQRAPTHVPMYM